MRSRERFRDEPTLGTLSLTALRTTLARHARLPCARPPSPNIVSLRGFHAERRRALLWVSLPPNDFCNFTLRRADTPTSIRFPRFEDPHFAVTPNSLSRSLLLFRVVATFPSRRRIARDANRDSPFRCRLLGAASTPQSTTPKATNQPRRHLRATPRPDHRLRR
jgi:hypothetical protein